MYVACARPLGHTNNHAIYLTKEIAESLFDEEIENHEQTEDEEL